MPEIFRFTQLREPSGINIEEVRLKHIRFFDRIEDVQDMQINKAFTKDFQSGIDAIQDYLKTNQGFMARSLLPNAVIRNEWSAPLNLSHRPYFELSYLLSQYNSDKKEDQNKDLFTQFHKTLKQVDSKNIKAALPDFKVYFEDLLVLFFNSNSYPSYLRLLIGLRRWHFVFSNFSLTEIKNSFMKVPDPKEGIKENTALYFLLNAKILLPKYLFHKKIVEVIKPKPNPKPVVVPTKKTGTAVKKDVKATKIKSEPTKKVPTVKKDAKTTKAKVKSAKSVTTKK